MKHAACLEVWPECIDGEYNPACCRFPKDCHCEIYEPKTLCLATTAANGFTACELEIDHDGPWHQRGVVKWNYDARLDKSPRDS